MEALGALLRGSAARYHHLIKYNFLGALKAATTGK